jgi:hypothetical protein
MRFQVFIILLISFHLNAQKDALFSGSIYSSPRFIEDSLLTRYQSKKVFKIKIKKKLVEEIKDYDENPFKNDSVKRATLGVYIDSLGITRFKYERPVGVFKSSFIELFKKAIDSLPKLVPAKMRTKNVGISYGLQFWNPIYIKNKKTPIP